MAQLIEISASSGLTGLVGKLFADGSDTVVATSSAVTEATNRKSIYVATFTGVTVGTYQMLLFDADSLPVASRTVRITAADGLFTEIGDEVAQVALIRTGLATSIALGTALTEIAKIPKAGETLRFSDADEQYDVQIARIV